MLVGDRVVRLLTEFVRLFIHSDFVFFNGLESNTNSTLTEIHGERQQTIRPIPPSTKPTTKFSMSELGTSFVRLLRLGHAERLLTSLERAGEKLNRVAGYIFDISRKVSVQIFDMFILGPHFIGTKSRPSCDKNCIFELFSVQKLASRYN